MIRFYPETVHTGTVPPLPVFLTTNHYPLTTVFPHHGPMMFEPTIGEQMAGEQITTITGYWISATIHGPRFTVHGPPFTIHDPLLPVFLLSTPISTIQLFPYSLVHFFTCSAHFFTCSLNALLPIHRSLTTNHYPLITVFLTTNHYPLITASTTPSPLPPGGVLFSAPVPLFPWSLVPCFYPPPMPVCETVKL